MAILKTTVEQRAEWAALADKATKGPWGMDRERQDDAPDRHYEFVVLDAAGRRLLGTENRDADAGLLEIEYDEEGATVWNELSRRDIAFIAASREALTALISLYPGIAQLIEGTGAVPPENIKADGSLFYFNGQYLDWSLGSDTACLDGDFTVKDLRAIADHMDHAMLAAAEREKQG